MIINSTSDSSSKTNIISKTDKDDIRLSFVISLVILCIYILNLSSGLSYLFSINVSSLSNVLKVILMFFFIARINIILRRFNLLTCFIIIITGIVITANILLFPQNNVYFSEYAINFATIHLPLMLYISTIVDYKYLIKAMTKVSFFIAVLSIVFFVLSILVLKSNFNNGQYLMGFSYACLLPSIILARCFIKTREFRSLILFAIMVIVILSYGSRGALFSIGVYFLLELFRKYFYQEKKHYKILFIVIIAIVCLLLYRPLLMLLNDILLNFNINSRTIHLFLRADFNLSIRSTLYQIVWFEFIKNPFAIRGINADYLLVNGYTHNIFIELLYEFGLFVGLPFILLILFFSFKTIFYPKETYLSECISIIFCASIPSLLVSHSVWDNMAFWMWFILCIKLFGRRKAIKIWKNDLVKGRVAGY